MPDLAPPAAPDRPRMRFQPALGVGLACAMGAFFAASFTGDFNTDWYRDLVRPDLLTPGLERAIPFIWGGIFLLVGVALAGVLAADLPALWRGSILTLMVVQLALNFSYTFVFTVRRDLSAAVGIAAALSAVTAAIILACAARRIPLAVASLLPYLCWATFATYLAGEIARLNR